jgi:hypothetical protein
MADLDSKWNQNIDKIAYSVAIVLGFIVLCIPLLAGGSADVNGLESALSELTRAIGKQQLPDYDAPRVKEKAVQQWTAGPALTNDPTWRTEVAPVLIVDTEKVSDTPCVHEPGEIVELRCERDPQAKVKKAAIVVKGKPSEMNSNVTLRKIVLERKAEGDASFQPVRDFKATGAFEHRDATVEAGKIYTYRLVTVAERDRQAPAQYVFDAAKEGTKASAEVTASGPVPYEFSLVPTSFDLQDINVPKFFGSFAYWDYAKGDVTEMRSKQFREKEELADKRFVIQNVDGPGQRVIVREPGGEPGKNTWEFTPRSTPRPVRPFAAVIPGAPPPEPEAPPVDAKASKSTKSAPPPRATAPKDKKAEATKKEATKKEAENKEAKKKPKGFTK